MRPRALVAWCLYDFGIAAWPVVVATFVWGTYYATAIRHSTEEGAAEWGATLALSGLVVAVFAPILGAIADRGGRRKPWIGTFVFLCVVATAFLWFSLPVPSAADRTLLFVGIGSVAYEFSLVFYNAMLRDLAPQDRLGRVSGWGWGSGYVGGLICLSIALFVFIKPNPPLLGLERIFGEQVRVTALLVAAWIVVFTMPLFALVVDRPKFKVTAWQAVREGLGILAESLGKLIRAPRLLRFLIARMIYADGLNTLFIFGGLYAAGSLDFTLEEVVVLGIAINATAGLGALGFAWVDDWLGSKTTIVLSLCALIVLGTGVLLVESKLWFWVLALALGVFVGPAQSASRTLMATICPRGIEAEMFGLYAMTGKITAFLGPAFYGLATQHWGSQRAGMASVILFLAVGLVLFLTVPVRRGSRPNDGSGASR